MAERKNVYNVAPCTGNVTVNNYLAVKAKICPPTQFSTNIGMVEKSEGRENFGAACRNLEAVKTRISIHLDQMTGNFLSHAKSINEKLSGLEDRVGFLHDSSYYCRNTKPIGSISSCRTSLMHWISWPWKQAKMKVRSAQRLESTKLTAMGLQPGHLQSRRFYRVLHTVFMFFSINSKSLKGKQLLPRCGTRNGFLTLHWFCPKRSAYKQ